MRTALVLGGGGVTGVAWQTGLLAGLKDGGVDLSDADLVVGTSAGAVVAAQVCGGLDLDELYAAELAGPGPEPAARLRAGDVGGWLWSGLRERDATRFRARIGRLALDRPTVPEAERRAVIAARLGPVSEWPARRLLLVTVDAESGEPRVIDKDSGVPLLDAVTASCAVPGIWPPATIDERRYVDGGLRSAANVDLAAGAERVVIVAPTTGGARHLPSVDAQVAQLRGTSRVVVISPDAGSKVAIGRQVVDPARRAPAARAGHHQAEHAAASVRAVWLG